MCWKGGRAPLSYAAKAGHVEVVVKLVELKADVNHVDQVEIACDHMGSCEMIHDHVKRYDEII